MQWFSLSQQIDSVVIRAVALASFYFEVGCLVFAHAFEETWTPVAIVGIAGTLLSTTCSQDTPTFSLFFSLGLSFSALLVHSVCGLCTLSSDILNSSFEDNNESFYVEPTEVLADMDDPIALVSHVGNTMHMHQARKQQDTNHIIKLSMKFIYTIVYDDLHRRL